MPGVFFPFGQSLIPADATRVVEDFDYKQASNNWRNRWQVRTTGGGSVLPLLGDASVLNWNSAQLLTPAAAGAIALTRAETQLQVPPANFWQFNVGVKLPVLSTGAQRYILRVGLGDQNTADFNNGVYFEYSDNLDLGEWHACVAVGGVRTKNATASFVTAGSEFGLSCFGFDNQLAIFKVNGRTVAGLGPLPTLPVGFVLQLSKTVGAAAALANIDYFGYYQRATR